MSHIFRATFSTFIYMTFLYIYIYICVYEYMCVYCVHQHSNRFHWKGLLIGIWWISCRYLQSLQFQYPTVSILDILFVVIDYIYILLLSYVYILFVVVKVRMSLMVTGTILVLEVLYMYPGGYIYYFHVTFFYHVERFFFVCNEYIGSIFFCILKLFLCLRIFRLVYI